MLPLLDKFFVLLFSDFGICGDKMEHFMTILRVWFASICFHMLNLSETFWRSSARNFLHGVVQEVDAELYLKKHLERSTSNENDGSKSLSLILIWLQENAKVIVPETLNTPSRGTFSFPRGHKSFETVLYRHRSTCSQLQRPETFSGTCWTHLHIASLGNHRYLPF